MPVAATPSLLGPDRVLFLNVERRCRSKSDWSSADATKLWRYNLHYFDDLNASAAEDRNAWHHDLLERWIVENLAGQGDGWESYPLSRRIVNWIKWALHGNAISSTMLDSLAVQVRWLSKTIEYHIMGNHLFANAKALVYAGLFFDGPEADTWYRKGFDIVADQLERQVLPDGGHFELSPMYHSAFLEDVLDLLNLHNAYARETPGRWTRICGRMRHWLGVMSHPDGEIAFFNDAAIGIAPSAAQIEAYASRLRLPNLRFDPTQSVSLTDSGYYRVAADGLCLICDCAPVGPDHLPAHAHADTLSFEFSIGDERVFVNSGTSQYGTDDERQRQRATAAHNTVEVDTQDSSEVWGGFRVARRARPTVHQIDLAMPAVIEASHDGYRRLAGKVTHRRRWLTDHSSLEITDTVEGGFQRSEARFHLHPDLAVTRAGPNVVTLHPRSGATIRMQFDKAEDIEISDGTWHPHFGISIDSITVGARFADATLSTRIDWPLD